jgi:hypothetical protein
MPRAPPFRNTWPRSCANWRIATRSRQLLMCLRPPMFASRIADGFFHYLASFHSSRMSLRNGSSGQLRCWGSTPGLSHYRPSTGQCSHIGLSNISPGTHVRLRMSQLTHGRSTFAMISRQLCRRARQGQGIASAFGTPVHWGCNDSVFADYRRIPSSSSRGGERAGARLGVRLCRGGRDRAPALAVGAVEGRPTARHARDRKAASRRALADRA